MSARTKAVPSAKASKKRKRASPTVANTITTKAVDAASKLDAGSRHKIPRLSAVQGGKKEEEEEETDNRGRGRGSGRKSTTSALDTAIQKYNARMRDAQSAARVMATTKLVGGQAMLEASVASLTERKAAFDKAASYIVHNAAAAFVGAPTGLKNPRSMKAAYEEQRKLKPFAHSNPLADKKVAKMVADIDEAIADDAVWKAMGRASTQIAQASGAMDALMLACKHERTQTGQDNWSRNFTVSLRGNANEPQLSKLCVKWERKMVPVQVGSLCKPGNDHLGNPYPFADAAAFRKWRTGEGKFAVVTKGATAKDVLASTVKDIPGAPKVLASPAMWKTAARMLDAHRSNMRRAQSSADK